MDYATHGDLHSLWLLEGAFSEIATRLYIAEIAMALAFLHRAGIIYRDLKMENILLYEGGHILLSDFGLSKWLKQGGRTSSVCGTLMYMAPEVLNMGDYDHRVDWWSLGIIMFCLMTGKYPLSGSTNHIEMYNKVINKEFKLPPFVSYPAQDVILQLLCKDPCARLSCLATLKRMEFFVGMSFEKVLSKQTPPTVYLKRKLPKTCQELIVQIPMSKKSNKNFYKKMTQNLLIDL
ncbi:ribosomal protein S6 kinase-related protein-like [Antedon mediterranea]|uniref:ribosomal protein S6 kinase-related protein-like n=1 Tax=Antedon mediterranea TaxID=105859 RepID=UPI003AF62462